MNRVLRDLCLANTDDLLKRYNGNMDKGYAFIDNGANVLAVAHLDVVDDYDYQRLGQRTARQYTETTVTTRKQAKKAQLYADDLPCTMVQTIALDDRLGLYIILDLLPKMGVKCDVLLTTDEEVGASTADEFTAPAGKQYNWIFSFDRRGTEVVMYQYHDTEMHDLMVKYGYAPEQGSFSDIAYLEHLGVKAFNFGTGYNLEHTGRCCASLTTVSQLARRFVRFYKDYANTRLPHTPMIGYSRYSRYSRYNGHGYTGYLHAYDDYYAEAARQDGRYQPQDVHSVWAKKDTEYIRNREQELANLGFASCDYCGSVFSPDDLWFGVCDDCYYILHRNKQ